MVIALPDLPYGYSDLAPHISERTLLVHHTKHHATYVTNTNNLIKGTILENSDLLDIIIASSEPNSSVDPGVRASIFNNSAQVYNHTFFWHSLAPSGGGGPSGQLAEKIKSEYGSFSKFADTFKDYGVKQFGSGWCWLIWDTDSKKLTIESTSNAGTPVIAKNKVPLLVVDVWEHAYYLDYENQRKKFLDIFIEKLANWQFAEQNFSDNI